MQRSYSRLPLSLFFFCAHGQYEVSRAREWRRCHHQRHRTCTESTDRRRWRMHSDDEAHTTSTISIFIIIECDSAEFRCRYRRFCEREHSRCAYFPLESRFTFSSSIILHSTSLSFTSSTSQSRHHSSEASSLPFVVSFALCELFEDVFTVCSPTVEQRVEAKKRVADGVLFEGMLLESSRQIWIGRRSRGFDDTEEV